MPDFTPAPGSTATSAPSATSFLTVSGVPATRGSAGSVSAAIAIFMQPPGAAEVENSGTTQQPPAWRSEAGSDEEISHQNQDDHDGDDVPLQELEEQLVGLLMRLVVVARGG